MRNDPDPFFFQGWYQVIIEQCILPRDQGVRGLRQSLKRGDGVNALIVLTLMSHQMGFRPNLKEFVQIGRHNTQVA